MANTQSTTTMIPPLVVFLFLMLPAELHELVYLWYIIIAEQNAEATGAGFEVP